MTNVRFDDRQLAPALTARSGNVRLRPSNEFVATDVSSHPRVRVEVIEQALVDGVLVIDLRPTDTGSDVPWCWVVLDPYDNPVVGLLVPTSSSTLNAEDLVRVDPATLAPNAAPPAAWWAAAVPTGGTTGQVLAKASDADRDLSWVTPTGGSGSSTVDGITDATATGKAIMKASDAAAARSAIGAGTSNLTIGTTGTTAAAGNDSRLSDTRTPTDGTVTDAKISGTLGQAKITGLTDDLTARDIVIEYDGTTWPARPSTSRCVVWRSTKYVSAPAPSAGVTGDVWDLHPDAS